MHTLAELLLIDFKHASSLKSLIKFTAYHCMYTLLEFQTSITSKLYKEEILLQKKKTIHPNRKIKHEKCVFEIANEEITQLMKSKIALLIN